MLIVERLINKLMQTEREYRQEGTRHPHRQGRV